MARGRKVRWLVGTGCGCGCPLQARARGSASKKKSGEVAKLPSHSTHQPACTPWFGSPRLGWSSGHDVYKHVVQTITSPGRIPKSSGPMGLTWPCSGENAKRPLLQYLWDPEGAPLVLISSPCSHLSAVAVPKPCFPSR